MAIATFDETLADEVTSVYNDDIVPTKATRVNDANDIQLPRDPSLLISLRLFFDPL